MKTDAQLKDDVIEELRWDPQISDADAIGVGVKDGAVILSGHEVDHDYPRREVERTVCQVPGVTGVLNNVTVRPPASQAQVQTLIEEMFKRQAEADAVHIRVEVSDHTARLYGQVHSLQAANAAQAAAVAPGVASVESHLVIAP
jgi:osmotically-inducible protein OsmY